MSAKGRACLAGCLLLFFLLALLPAGPGEAFLLPLFYALLGLGVTGALCLFYRWMVRRPPVRLPCVWLALLLGAALALRVLLLLQCDGYANDVACFSGWSQLMVEAGPARFYTSGVFADYPPGYLYLLWAGGLLNRWLGFGGYTAAGQLVLALPALLSDLGLAALAYGLACRRRGPRFGLAVAALLAFAPALWWNSAVWRQVDAVLALALALCFWLLMRQRWAGAALLYGVALLLKPQALFFGPVLAAAFLQPYLAPGDGRNLRLPVLARCLGCAALSLGVVWLGALPFGAGQRPDWLLRLYLDASDAYPYASINAFNLFGLLGGNWAPQEAGWLLSYRQWGLLFLGLLTVALFWLLWQGSGKGPCLPLAAAFYGLGVFTLVQNMHERYSLPAFVLLAFGYLWQPSKKLRACLLAQGFLCFMNLSLVLAALENSAVLELPEYQAAQGLCSLGQVLNFGLLCWVCLRRAGVAQRLGRPPWLRWPGWFPMAQATGNPPPWGRADWLGLGLCVACCALLTFSGLGSLSAPQTPWQGEAPARLETASEPAALWVYGGLGEGALLLLEADGREAAYIPMEDGNLFCWKSCPLPADSAGPYTLQAVGNPTVYELVFLDSAGAVMEATADAGGAALLDEQTLWPGRPSQRHGMYFDEIYHARTAYEYLHGLPLYETTHPPLGKELIALSIALFGMTPFGWRFMPALFGVLAVALFFLLGRRLTGRPFFAFLAAGLYTLDLLRFTLARIATVDIFLTAFLLAAYLFFLRWLQLDWVKAPLGRQLWPLAFSGLAFGLACAVKWNGVYGGAGLAVVFLLALRRGALAHPDRWRRRLRPLLLCCAGCFALVPAAVYLAAYLPCFFRPAGCSLGEIWQMQLQMLRYHTALTATHAYASRWWSWPAMLRPVWVYMGVQLPRGWAASIAMLGNPALWWPSMAAVGLALLGKCRGSRDQNLTLLLAGFFSLWLPWALVTRPAFLYHFYPSESLALLLLVYLLAHLPPRAQWVPRVLAGAAAVCFLLFYPATAGIPVPDAYAGWLQWLPRWNFYAL